MRVSDFDYDLPPERIAQRPADERDGARLLQADGPDFVDGWVRDVAERIPKRALVVVNDTRVVPARLHGIKAGSGGRVELFLLKRLDSTGLYEVLGRASKALRAGAVILFGDHLQAVVTRVSSANDSTLVVRFSAPETSSVEAEIERIGHMPLPPYVEREDDSSDRERYQTVFAKVPGAVAAPTAGLHLSERILSALSEREIEIASLTLHVGLGTFQPVKVADLDDHPMHSEWFEISPGLADSIASARERKAPVVAIGTTVVRALESAKRADAPSLVSPTKGDTRLLIQPGYSFGVVDLLFTNFHLPKSTLLALVCAFGGTERVLSAYRHAVAHDYRFFSYGDAMFLPRSTP